MPLFWFGLGLIIASSIINVACYVGCSPTGLIRPRPAVTFTRRLAALLHGLAYGLAVARVPFAIVPYAAKAALYLALAQRFGAWWNQPVVQAARLVGEGVNWAVTLGLLLVVARPAPAWVGALIQLAGGAELLRLVLEKGQVVVSGGWQLLPHQRLAQWLRRSRFQRAARAYTHYYRRDAGRRLACVARWLRGWSAHDAELAAPLAYVRGFRMVPPEVSLRTGQVRDVARGEIWVHARWSQDPWLLIGQALRRSPWLFDPRHLRRPFYYRSEANPRATRLVLQLAWYCPPFALYQLGHEIKAARFELFFRLSRALGVELEAPVQADGTYQFDPLLTWLGARLGRVPPPPRRPLWTVAQALTDLAQRIPAAPLTTEELAARYTVPLGYVEEVLLPATRHAAVSASVTASGASQWG